MANNYTEFSEIIECDKKQQQDWLLEQFKKDDRSYACAAEPDRDNVWVHSDESGDMGPVADVIAEFQTTFKITKPWIGSYCYNCDKPRISEFGGGAVVVNRGKQYWFDATSLANAKAKKLA